MESATTNLHATVVAWVVMWPWLGFWAWAYLRKTCPRETRAWEWPFAMFFAPFYILAAFAVYCQWRR